MIADVEAIDKVFCERFTDGSQQEFLDRCSRSQAASQEYISNLDLPSPIKENMHSSSFFAEFGMERFIHFQEEYQRALTLRSQTDGSFRMRLGNDMAARSEMYQKMYRTILPNLDIVQREEFLTQRTIRTMAQYLTLGKLISESSRYPVIISHPTRNSGMFNDRNKYMVGGERIFLDEGIHDETIWGLDEFGDIVPISTSPARHYYIVHGSENVRSHLEQEFERRKRIAKLVYQHPKRLIPQNYSILNLLGVSLLINIPVRYIVQPLSNFLDISVEPLVRFLYNVKYKTFSDMRELNSKKSPEMDGSLSHENDLNWLDTYSGDLKKYAGKWIAVVAPHGIVAVGDTMREVSEGAESHSDGTPLLLRLPEEELEL